MLKNWCFWTVVLEKTLESPLDCKEIQPVHPKGNQSWIFIGRTDAEAKTSIFWPPDVKNWLIWKDPDAGTDWRQEEKGTTEDEMVGWHHRLNEHAAAAAKSLQSCPTLCDPIDCSPSGSPVPGILQARILEQVAISSSNAWKWKVKVKSLSRITGQICNFATCYFVAIVQLLSQVYNLRNERTNQVKCFSFLLSFKCCFIQDPTLGLQPSDFPF